MFLLKNERNIENHLKIGALTTRILTIFYWKGREGENKLI